MVILEHGGLYVDMDCPVWPHCLHGCFDSRHATPACLLLQDFECLRPLDELHHVTSFYTGMSNVPLATVEGYRYQVLFQKIKPTSSLMC